MLAAFILTFSSVRANMLSVEKRRRESAKFLENFDPETSARERRKLTRKYTTGRKPNTLYDSRGHISGADLCDCLVASCPGCHFPCPKCSSNKCATECRVNRKWSYDKVGIEGTAP